MAFDRHVLSQGRLFKDEGIVDVHQEHTVLGVLLGLLLDFYVLPHANIRAETSRLLAFATGFVDIALGSFLAHMATCRGPGSVVLVALQVNIQALVLLFDRL